MWWGASASRYRRLATSSRSGMLQVGDIEPPIVANHTDMISSPGRSRCPVPQARSTTISAPRWWTKSCAAGASPGFRRRLGRRCWRMSVTGFRWAANGERAGREGCALPIHHLASVLYLPRREVHGRGLGRHERTRRWRRLTTVVNGRQYPICPQQKQERSNYTKCVTFCQVEPAGTWSTSQIDGMMPCTSCQALVVITRPEAAKRLPA